MLKRNSKQYYDFDDLLKDFHLHQIVTLDIQKCSQKKKTQQSNAVITIIT